MGEFLLRVCLHRDCFTSGVWFNERDLPSLAIGWGTCWLSWEDWAAKSWKGSDFLWAAQTLREQGLWLEGANIYRLC